MYYVTVWTANMTYIAAGLEIKLAYSQNAIGK